MQHKLFKVPFELPLEVMDYGDHMEIGGIKFTQFDNLSGFAEIFSRKDYEFGGVYNSVFIDVGANIGDSTLYVATNEAVDKVYAYEPFPETYKIAAQNIALNPELAQKIELLNYAWSDENSVLQVPVCDDINASAVNTIKAGFASEIRRNRTNVVEVEAKKSSEILKKIIESHPDQPIILKMDIEGAEYDCIAELLEANMLDKIDVILMEWHLAGHECITNILESNNFIWFNENLSGNTGFIRAYRK